MEDGMATVRMRLVAVSMVSIAVAGCSAQSTTTRPRLPAAAEPSTAAPLTTRPVGRLVTLPSGSSPEGVVVDPTTHLVAVALHHPDRLALVSERTDKVVRIVDVPASARHLQL